MSDDGSVEESMDNLFVVATKCIYTHTPNSLESIENCPQCICTLLTAQDHIMRIAHISPKVTHFCISSLTHKIYDPKLCLSSPIIIVFFFLFLFYLKYRAICCCCCCCCIEILNKCTGEWALHSINRTIKIRVLPFFILFRLSMRSSNNCLQIENVKQWT